MALKVAKWFYFKARWRLAHAKRGSKEQTIKNKGLRIGERQTDRQTDKENPFQRSLIKMEIKSYLNSII